MKAVSINPGLLKKIRAKRAAERHEIGERTAEGQRSMGHPHLHKGIGLRKLQDVYYEIRVGFKQRLVFENTLEVLIFEFLGDHDEVKRFLKSR